MAYRISRNIEASIIDFLKVELAAAVPAWSNITVEKSFARVYKIALDPHTGNAIICIRAGITTHDPAEMGSNASIRTPQVLIDLFCVNDGQRLDLKDFLISKLKHGMIYYEYTIVNGQVQSKVQNGRIRVIDIDDTPINFDTDKSAIDDIHDRYRHLLTLGVSLGQVEA